MTRLEFIYLSYYNMMHPMVSPSWLDEILEKGWYGKHSLEGKALPNNLIQKINIIYNRILLPTGGRKERKYLEV